MRREFEREKRAVTGCNCHFQKNSSAATDRLPQSLRCLSKSGQIFNYIYFKYINT